MDEESITNTHKYQLKRLTDEDISTWTKFCADCFSYKPNPPPASYFERHFKNDPRRDSSLIRVMCCKSNGNNTNTTNSNKNSSSSSSNEEPIIIVSSIRIFQKTISLGNGKTIEAGGIGEVCTSVQHRKKGLARQLLHNAIDTMINERKMQCSLLHASPHLTPVYEKSGGYVCVMSKWSVLNIDMKYLNDVVIAAAAGGDNEEEEEKDHSWNVRLASFPDDTEQLQCIHQKYSEERFAGCIIRSIEYWNEYLKNEIGKSLFVLTYKNKLSNDGEGEFILGWISIRQRNGRLQLVDFGVNLVQSQALGYGTSHILSRLLKVSLEQECIIATTKSIELHLPTAIVDEMRDEDVDCPWLDLSNVRSDDDIGWMYKMLQLSHEDSDDNNDIIEIVNKLNVPHLIWPSDSF